MISKLGQSSRSVLELGQCYGTKYTRGHTHAHVKTIEIEANDDGKEHVSTGKFKARIVCFVTLINLP